MSGVCNIVSVCLMWEEVSRIFSGDRLCIYRRSMPMDVKYVVMYNWNMLRMITGVFKVDWVMRGDRWDVWKETGHLAGVSKRGYTKWSRGMDRCYAVKIGDVYRLEKYLPLSVLGNVRFLHTFPFVRLRETLKGLSQKLGIDIKE